MSTRTFIDASVLIAAARGTEPWAERAFRILGDAERSFVSSEFVRLEVLPKASYLKRAAEVELYESFFAGVAHWVGVSEDLLKRAYDRACEAGLSAIDAFHVAAAEEAAADELVTKERPDTPLHRTKAVKVVTIH